MAKVQVVALFETSLKKNYIVYSLFNLYYFNLFGFTTCDNITKLMVRFTCLNAHMCMSFIFLVCRCLGDFHQSTNAFHFVKVIGRSNTEPQRFHAKL